MPSTAALLTEGRDARLTLDSADGRNAYLCRPQPDDALLRFGSSTATEISAEMFAAAEQIRAGMVAKLAKQGRAALCADTEAAICAALRSIWQLDAQVAITLIDSGTACHRVVVTHLLAERVPGALQLLMVDAAETGRGVPAALMPDTAPYAGRVQCSEIAIRDAAGVPLAADAIDAAVVAQTELALQRGASVLLVLVDQSKSGMAAPSLDCALALRRRDPARVHLLLDGCQSRFSAATLRGYLAQGVMVAVTGSKFFAAPSFSGALLLPDGAAIAAPPVTLGLLLRWQLALQVMQAFAACDAQALYDLVHMAGEQLRCVVQPSPYLELLPTTPIARSAVLSSDELAWDQLPTIFPLRLRLPSRGAATGSDGLGDLDLYADMESCLAIYRQLQLCDGERVQLGRPIAAGRRRDGTVIGGLRCALSAPLLCAAVGEPQRLLDPLMRVLARLESAVRAQDAA